MLDYDPLAGYRDPQAYDLEDGGYMAEHLAHLRHLIQTQGLHREERGDELLWRRQEFPGNDF